MNRNTQKLQLNDSKFFKKIILDLTNVNQMYLRPILGDALQARGKVHSCLALLAEEDLPIFLTLKDGTTMKNNQIKNLIKEVKEDINAIDKAIYEEPLIEYVEKYPMTCINHAGLGNQNEGKRQK